MWGAIKTWSLPDWVACNQEPQTQHDALIFLPQTVCITRFPGKPNPPLPACSQQSQFHPYDRFPIPSCQLNPSSGRFTLPVKPDPQWPACSQWSQIVRGVREKIPVLPACCQPRQIVREMRVRIPVLPACSQRSRIVSVIRVIIPPLPACFEPTQNVRDMTVRILSFTACSQELKTIRGVRVSIPPLPANTPRTLIHSDQQCRFHPIPAKPDSMLPGKQLSPLSTHFLALHFRLIGWVGYSTMVMWSLDWISLIDYVSLSWR